MAGEQLKDQPFGRRQLRNVHLTELLSIITFCKSNKNHSPLTAHAGGEVSNVSACGPI